MSKSKQPIQPNAKKSTGRKCSVCSDKRVKEINSAINRPVSFRVISRQFLGDEKHHDSVQRHANNCLKLEIQALVKEKKIENAIDHYEEIREQLRFAKKLRIAAEDYLTDPETGQITLMAHAAEIEVIYFNLHNAIKNGGNKKEKAKLQDLLDWIATSRPQIEPQTSVLKQTDARSFALDAIRATDLVLDKVAKVRGLYQENRINESDELGLLKKQIERVAADQGTDYQTELTIFLREYADKIKPDLRVKLSSELVQ